MNSLTVAFIFSLSLAFALDAPSSTPKPSEKEAKAIQECNATIPVKRNPREVIERNITGGLEVKLDQDEKCFLNCYLQKVGFLDQNSNIRNGKRLVNFTIRQDPKILNYSDVLIAQIFQISRSTKSINENCQKAFVIYHQFAQGIFTSELAYNLQADFRVKDKIVEAIETGRRIDENFAHQIEESLTIYDSLTKILSYLGDNAQ
ncbi:uncharacterized protein LOC135838593 [Planococcus citri]|uniref:uncharacterized protein LOC135838593 n=1 Tax=Planococcus citri TaxID=170843 RepID=UPI0031F93319